MAGALPLERFRILGFVLPLADATSQYVTLVSRFRGLPYDAEDFLAMAVLEAKHVIATDACRPPAAFDRGVIAECHQHCSLRSLTIFLYVYYLAAALRLDSPFRPTVRTKARWSIAPVDKIRDDKHCEATRSCRLPTRS